MMSAESKINQKIEDKKLEYSKPNYLMMCVWMGLGLVFLLASVTSLPFVILAPSGFCMYFSMSSFCFLISVAFYNGPSNYCHKLCCDVKTLPITLLYLGSTGASLYCSLFMSIGYVYTMSLIAVQTISVTFFVIQAWTGGQNA